MSELTLVGCVLDRTKTFLDDHKMLSEGFTLSVLLDIGSLAGRPHPVMPAQQHEWTFAYRVLVTDVQAIIAAHTDTATGSPEWHDALDELIEIVRLDYAHR